MNCKCLVVLTAEHKTILRIADVLQAMSKTAEDHSEFNIEDVGAVVQILRHFGDEFHQRKEETALFPVFTAACNPSEFAAVKHMLFEHEHDRSLINGMDDAIARANAAQFSEYGTQLANMLRNHIYKEDNILFETIGGSLSSADDAKVMTEFEFFEQDFESRNKAELMEQLRLLEWKYLRRVA
jgi:hemerythrin-like domain-containing protein